jgi:hypothetical protein
MITEEQDGRFVATTLFIKYIVDLITQWTTSQEWTETLYRFKDIKIPWYIKYMFNRFERKPEIWNEIGEEDSKKIAKHVNEIFLTLLSKEDFNIAYDPDWSIFWAYEQQGAKPYRLVNELKKMGYKSGREAIKFVSNMQINELRELCESVSSGITRMKKHERLHRLSKLLLANYDGSFYEYLKKTGTLDLLRSSPDPLNFYLIGKDLEPTPKIKKWRGKRQDIYGTWERHVKNLEIVGKGYGIAQNTFEYRIRDLPDEKGGSYMIKLDSTNIDFLINIAPCRILEHKPEYHTYKGIPKCDIEKGANKVSRDLYFDLLCEYGAFNFHPPALINTAVYFFLSKGFEYLQYFNFFNNSYVLPATIKKILNEKLFACREETCNQR